MSLFFLLLRTSSVFYFILSIGAGGGGRVSAVVRALSFNQCGWELIPELDGICGFSLLVLYSAPRGFSLGTPVFPSQQKLSFHLTSN